jgi:hypothetical protein
MYEKQRRIVTSTVTQGGMQMQVQEEVWEDVWVPDPPPPQPTAEQAEAAKAAVRRDPALDAQSAIAEYKQQVLATFEKTKRELGYLPPHDSPLLVTRALRQAVELIRHRDTPELRAAIAETERDIEAQFGAAHGFVKRLREKLAEPESLLQRLRRAVPLPQNVDELVNKATISLDVPKVGTPALAHRMHDIEMFLGEAWTTESHRSVLAVHIDKTGPTTILQIGIAEHGPLYICLPGLLVPEQLAQASIYELVRRLEPFRELADPMAVIDGGHQGINYNPLFKSARVIRAPSGDMSRLAANLSTTRARARMEPMNTAIINSAPTTAQEYVAVFEDDPAAVRWPRWGGVAAQWTGAAARDGFAVGPDASREAMLTALTTSENVIVVMAHCDGQRLFLPHPPPTGTDVTAEHLRQRRDDITKNKPFVLLFSCHTGQMAGVMSFAEVLLECGAAGVVAAQGTVGASALDYLTRLLSQQRGTPPIEDVWKAMRDTNFYEMEAFLA